MMKKDINTEQIDTDDFDKLLDDFIKSSLQEDDSKQAKHTTSGVEKEPSMLPHIKNAVVKTDDNASIAFSNEVITVVITCDYAMKKTTDFRFSCYNSNYFKMCEMTSKVKARRRKFDVSFVSWYKWLPGEYAIYGEVNGVPVCKISFLVTVSNVEITGIEHLTVMSPGYHLMKDLDGEDVEWDFLQKVSCMGAIRAKILTRFSTYGVIDDLRRRRGMGRIYRNCNYIIRGFHPEHWILDVELIMRFLKDSGTYMYNDCNELTASSSYNDMGSPVECRFPTGDNGIVAFGGLQGLFSAKGNDVVRKMVKFMENGDNRSLVLCGSKCEIEQVAEAYPVLKDYFPDDNVVDIEPMKAYEIIYKIQNLLSKQDMTLSSQAYRELAQAIIKAVAEGKLTDWTENNVKEYVNNHIVERFCSRIINQMKSVNAFPDNIREITVDDVNFDVFCHSEDTFDECVEELNEMVGLVNLKGEISKAFNYVRFNSIRRNMGLKADVSTSHHMIFTGNPGTGKTTVAKKIGKIYRSLGLLSKGEVIVTERSKMVGRYIGETEQNMVALLEEARGNVLFVDEAYTLCDLSNDRKDFGCHALECLLTVLSQKNPDMLIIFAGYEDEINKMLQFNQGMEGRFPHRFHFEDYSADELMQIACKLLRDADYELSREATERLKATIDESVMHKGKDFSNARWITQYVANGIIPAVGQRVLSSGVNPTRDLCRTIETEDVECAYEKYRLDAYSKSRPTLCASLETLPKVGFRVA